MYITTPFSGLRVFCSAARCLAATETQEQRSPEDRPPGISTSGVLSRYLRSSDPTSGGTNLVVMYGEKEGSDYPLLKKRSEETANLATSSKLIIVENAPHDISFPEYQTAIKKVV